VSTTRIAIVGAGKGGNALLKDLVKIPSISIKYVCDINNDTEGMTFAREHGIKTYLWNDIMSVLKDQELDMFQVPWKKQACLGQYNEFRGK